MLYGIGISKGLGMESIRIGGKKHVLFRGESGKVSMLEAQCPHRGANLCKGKIKGDRVQCPYHGWEYDADGKLVKVPSTPTITVGGNIGSKPVVEDGGFIWTAKKNQPLPTRYCKELTDPSWVQVYGSKNLEGNIYDWILNATDISHINYVHNFADEDNGIVKNLKIETIDDYVDCYAVVQPKASSIFTEHMQPRDGAPVHSRFVAPATSIIRIKLAGKYEFITFSTLSPIDDTHTKMSWCMMYPKTPLMNNSIVNKRFHDKMYETVAQDEAIIKEIDWVPMFVNAPCDKFQIEALKLLEK